MVVAKAAKVGDGMAAVAVMAVVATVGQ